MAEPRPDDQVRAEDQERVGNDAVSRRAISVGNVVRNRRAAPDADVERASERSHYRDLDGRRRVVGAGQAVPDGWTRIGPASLEDRQEASLQAAGVGDLAGTSESSKQRARKGGGKSSSSSS